MNLFLKKNIFIETNRSNSTSSIQSFQLNKLATKNSTSKIENTSLLNNFHNKILSPKVASNCNSYLFKKISDVKINKNIFFICIINKNYFFYIITKNL